MALSATQAVVTNDLLHSEDVKSRLFVHPLDEQFRLFAAPLLQCLNGRLMLQSALRDEVVVG